MQRWVAVLVVLMVVQSASSKVEKMAAWTEQRKVDLKVAKMVGSDLELVVRMVVNLVV